MRQKKLQNIKYLHNNIIILDMKIFINIILMCWKAGTPEANYK